MSNHCAIEIDVIYTRFTLTGRYTPWSLIAEDTLMAAGIRHPSKKWNVSINKGGVWKNSHSSGFEWELSNRTHIQFVVDFDMCACVYIYICMYIHAYMYANMHMYIHIFTVHVIYVSIYYKLNVCIFVCVYQYIHVYLIILPDKRSK